MHRILQRNADLYFRDLVPELFLDLGDFNRATHRARQGLGTFLQRLPGVRRDLICQWLGITRRTLENWMAASRAPAEEGGDTVVSPSEGALFRTVMERLLEAGDEFLSLGQLTDYVNSRLEADLSTSYVRERLEWFSRLGQAERHPEKQEWYRSSVRNPSLSEEGMQFREEVLRAILSCLFPLTFQVLAGAPDAGARIIWFQVPENAQEQFSTAMRSHIIRMHEELQGLEAQLNKQFPDARRTSLTFSMLFGRNSRHERSHAPNEENMR